MTSDAAVTRDARRTRNRRSFRVWFRRSGFRHAVAMVAVFFALYPVVWILSSAFNASDSLAAARLIPREVTLDNFTGLFDTNVTNIGRWLWNSFYIAIIAAAANTFVAALAAHAFSRIEFRGRRTLLTSLLVMQIFPQFLGFIAFFVLAQQIGEVVPFVGLNTHAFLILVYIGGAAGFNAFLLKGFLDSIPRSLDDAARIDGAGPFTVFWRIVMPLARPMLAVIFMISFIAIFSEFILASFLLRGSDNLTLPIGLDVFLAEGYNAKWGLLSAVALLGSAPIVLVFIAAQKHIIGGLTQGGIKG